MKKNDPKKVVIAEKLKKGREMAGLSQGQVAKMLNLHRPSISEIEAGRRNVSAEELTKFADIYQVSVSWLLDEEEENKEQIQMIARELNKLDSQSLDKIMSIVSAVRSNK